MIRTYILVTTLHYTPKNKRKRKDLKICSLAGAACVPESADVYSFIHSLDGVADRPRRGRHSLCECDRDQYLRVVYASSVCVEELKYHGEQLEGFVRGLRFGCVEQPRRVRGGGAFDGKVDQRHHLTLFGHRNVRL